MKAVLWLLVWLPGALMAASLPVNTKLGGDFQLPSTLGSEARLSDFKGKVVLLNFGFTSCPDVCPMVLGRMAKVMAELEKQRTEVRPIFVTVDPERDDVARLTQYLDYFGKDFVGFTGTQDQLSAVAKQYGVVAIPQKSESAAGTVFSHSDFIYLLDRKGRVRALYGQSDKIDDIVDDVKSLLAD